MTFRPPIIITIRARFAAPAEYIVNLNPLYYNPNPAQPFVQTNWPRPANPKPVQASDAPANLSPSYFPNPTQPFSQSDWLGPQRPVLTKPSDAAANLPQFAGPVARTVFRSPLIVTIPARLAAKAEYVVNVIPLLYPVVPFFQTDWPRPQNPGRVQASDAPANLLPNYFPNPKAPFSLAIWESAKAPLLKATGEAFALSPLLTVSFPFNQYDWRLPARVPLSLKSDTYSPTLSLYFPNPSAPFQQSLWDSPTRAFPKAFADPIGALPPAKIPFSQSIWDAPARPLSKAAGDIIIYQPAPPYPPNQGDWTRVLKPAAAKVDDYVNLLPIQTASFIVIPFHQNDWPSASRTPISLKSEVYGGPRTLLSPNPAQPFTQQLWDSATPYKAKANTGEAISGLYALFGPTTLPFTQSLWENATLARSKANPGEAYATPLYPAYYPNPTQPFSQGDWPLSALAPRPSDRGFVESINFSLSPPPVSAGLHSKQFFASVGGMMGIPGDTLPSN